VIFQRDRDAATVVGAFILVMAAIIAWREFISTVVR
jgi:hypothetical protein